MNRKNRLILFVSLILVFLVTQSPFLPGPKFLSGPLGILIHLGILLSVFSILIIVIWTFASVIAHKKFRWKYFANSKRLILLANSLFFIISCLYISKLTVLISIPLLINQSEPLIKEINIFYEKNEVYPEKLSELNYEIPTPIIMGVDFTNYRRVANSFNIDYDINAYMWDWRNVLVYYSDYQSVQAAGQVPNFLNEHDTVHPQWFYYHEDNWFFYHEK